MEKGNTSIEQLGSSKIMSEQSITSSILEKFQQLSKDKEKNRENEDKTHAPKQNKNQLNQGKKRKHKYSEDNKDIYIGLKEHDVGMTEFISELKGFKGIIKHRLSDFQVHEINLEDKVVELTSFEIPSFEIEEGIPCPNYKELMSSSEIEELKSIMLSDAQQQRIFEIDVTGKSKQGREDLHKTIKYMFDCKLYSNTKTITSGNDIRTVIAIGKCSAKPERTSWPKKLGHYLHFTLYKENMDTSFVANTISQRLRVRPNHITYAGIKDKRGKTSQRMCVKLRRAEQLVGIRKYLHQVSFGNFSYQAAPLRLGDLSGNQFTLAIRNIDTNDEEIINGIEHLKEFGFINYFGMQRFGSSITAPTFAVGKQLLLTNWKEAVNLILKPRYNERCSFEFKKCREVWAETMNAAAALKCLLHKDSSLEAQILRALKNQGNEQFFNALFSIPRNSLLLYLHSYQSLVWNKIVSRRIKKFGCRVLPGDLVLSPDDTKAIDKELSENFDPNDCDDDGNGIEMNLHEDIVLVKKDQRRCYKVRKLSPEEAEKTKFCEIVYPLPGKDIEFPDNEIADWYIDVLAEDGINLEHFEKSNKAFALYGAYRKAVQVPENLTFKIVKYSNHNDDFIPSDLEKMKTITLKTSHGGQYKAVILNFKLKPSTYATMLMRELLKCDTTLSAHAKWSRDIKTEKPEEKKIKIKDVANNDIEIKMEM